MRPLPRRQSMWSRPFRRLLRTPWPRCPIVQSQPTQCFEWYSNIELISLFFRRLKTPSLTSLTLCDPASRSGPRTAVLASPAHPCPLLYNTVAYLVGLWLTWYATLQPGHMKGRLSANFLAWMKQIVITLPLVCDIRRSLIIYSLRKNYDFMYASDDVQELENIQIFTSMHRWKAHVRGLCSLLEMDTCFEKS